MTDHSVTNWTRADDAMVEGAIRRGASRRELLRMLMAGGISLAAGGSILGPRLGRARCDPGDGRPPEGRGLHRLDRRHPRPGQGLERHRLHARLRLLQPPDLPQREQRSADGARRERRDHRRQGLDRQAEVRGRVPRRQDPLLRRRGLLAPPPPRRGGRLQGELDRQAVRRHQGRRPADRRDHARRARTPTCRPSSPCTTS